MTLLLPILLWNACGSIAANSLNGRSTSYDVSVISIHVMIVIACMSFDEVEGTFFAKVGLGLRQFTVRPVFRMIFPHFSISENLCKPCGYDAAQVVAHAPG